jgi:hypothetical protein
MRRAVLALLTPAVCFSQSADVVVQPIGPHQYTVTGQGAEPFRKADETCKKLGRTVNLLPMPAPTDPDAHRWQLNFECYAPYEVLSVGDDSYKIQVPTEMMGRTPFTIPAANGIPARTIQVPDDGPAGARAEQLGRDYCAKMNKTMKITGGGFDMGPGFRVIFKCVTPQQEPSAR